MSSSSRPALHLFGRIGVTAVAAFATVATSAPAALAAEGDLAPETSEPTSTDAPTDVEIAPVEQDDAPAEETPSEEQTAKETPAEQSAEEQPAASADEQAEDVDPAPTDEPSAAEEVEYGAQSFTVTFTLDPDGYHKPQTGRGADIGIYEGDVYLRTLSCLVYLDATDAGKKATCLADDGSSTFELGPGERAEVTGYEDDGTSRTMTVEPCPAAECSAEPTSVDFLVQGPAPIAQNRSLQARPGEPVTLDVLSFDNTGDPDTVVTVSQPGHGSVRVTDDELQRLVYTAAEDYSGPDSFAYTLTNTNGSSTGEVTIAVSEDAVTPDFGTRKYRIGTQVASGAFVPEGTTTVGSTITITTYPAGGGAPEVETCTTSTGSTGPFIPTDGPFFPPFELAAAAEGPTGLSSCPGDIAGIGSFLRLYTAPPGARVEITQSAVPDGQALVPDPRTVVIEPCDLNLTPGCGTEEVTFTATGSILPVTRADTATAEQGGPAIEVDVLANDDSEDPDTGLEVTPLPEGRGTVEVVGAAETPVPEPTDGVGTLAVPSAGTLRLRYTPPTGFSGTVPVQYAVTNSNGSTTGTLTITVEATEPVDPGPVDPDPVDPDPVDPGTDGGDTGSGDTDGGDVAPAAAARDDASSTTASRTGVLPRTGGPDAALAPLGALLVAAGAAALTRARRRPAASRGH
ncbi:Ig-like domain-containing protein [Aeromicrobium sp.]|uniref:Ig-like domain-containing protein n=1 Tax=Aeromicrobium sp. TaxID=1871063 RepID=UPI0040338874